MAFIKLASYLQSLNGTIGNMVYFNKYGREYARVYVKPANPDTKGQKIIRRTFGDAVRLWQGLSIREKERYHRMARKLPMSGYNLFISRYMKQNVPSALRNPAFTVYKDILPIIRNASSSVSTPPGLENGFLSSVHCCANSPGMD